MKSQLDPDMAKLLSEPPLAGDFFAGLTPEEAREKFKALFAAGSQDDLPKVRSAEDIPVDGSGTSIPARLYRPETDEPVATIVYFHGGGWMVGDLDCYDRQARLQCEQVGAAVLSVNYRLAPEHPFPTPFEDCLAATRWASENAASLGISNRIAVSGDSAGASLAASVALASRDEGFDLAVQLLNYPATDLVGAYRSRSENAKYPSREENAEGYFLTLGAMQWFAENYVPDEEQLEDPRVSPLMASDLAGSPPALICTVGFDPLRDEGRAYARALEEAGAQVVLRHVPNLIHGFLGLGRVSPAAREAARRVCEDLKDMLAASR